jgi:hypothetical protein
MGLMTRALHSILKPVLLYVLAVAIFAAQMLSAIGELHHSSHETGIAIEHSAHMDSLQQESDEESSSLLHTLFDVAHCCGFVLASISNDLPQNLMPNASKLISVRVDRLVMRVFSNPFRPPIAF